MSDESLAICYVRVSTEEQATQGVSLAAQEERVRAYCAGLGLTLQVCLREEGVSTRIKLERRPAGKELLAWLKRHPGGHLVVVKLDRIFRNTLEALSHIERWDKTGTTLHILEFAGGQAVNTKSAMGRMMLTIVAAFAELERNMISERTRAALLHKRQHREVYAPTPLGFTRDGTHLVADFDEQLLVARIYGLAQGGLGLRGIARLLNQEGVPRKRGGARWYASTVRGILRNPLHHKQTIA